MACLLILKEVQKGQNKLHIPKEKEKNIHKKKKKKLTNQQKSGDADKLKENSEGTQAKQHIHCGVRMLARKDNCVVTCHQEGKRKTKKTKRQI